MPLKLNFLFEKVQIKNKQNSIAQLSHVVCLLDSVDLTSISGYDPGVLLWADPRLWLVHTEAPMSRPHPPQTVQTNNKPGSARLGQTNFPLSHTRRLKHTCRVLSNQRLPLLENVPPPCRTWAALRLAYLSIKGETDKNNRTRGLE